jgi:hypothetical protein
MLVRAATIALLIFALCFVGIPSHSKPKKANSKNQELDSCIDFSRSAPDTLNNQYQSAWWWNRYHTDGPLPKRRTSC